MSDPTEPKPPQVDLEDDDDDGELDENDGGWFDDPDFRMALEELERKWFKEAVIFHKHLVSEIHDAAAKGRLDLLRVCIEEKGQSVDELDKAQNSPLHWAAGAGQDEVVRYLIQRGCQLNAVNLLGDTALHRAVWRSYKSTVAILLEAGIVRNVVNKQGHKPIDLVRDTDVGALLQQYDPLEYAKPNDGGATTDESKTDEEDNVIDPALRYEMIGFSDDEEGEPDYDTD